MAAAVSDRRNEPQDDELDDLFNDDIFDTTDIHPQQRQEPQKQTQRKPATSKDEVNIDEEIKVVKKRAPIPKLDDERLLSAAGVPKLRRISKERLRFKGKGHEYTDIARLLNMYQLWLDDLYPRAKFAHGLAIIEKLGHSKRMGYMRRGWVDESKPKTHVEDGPEEPQPEPEPSQPDEARSADAERIEGAIRKPVEEGPRQPGQGGSPRQLTASPRALAGLDPDEDELDALLAETMAPRSTTTPAVAAPRSATVEEDMFAEEMEAMAEMDGMW